MSRDDDETPVLRTHRRSSLNLQTWGAVEAWLAQDPDMRRVEFLTGPGGLTVRVTFGQLSTSEVVARDEDPSTAVLRAISALAAG